MYEDIAYLYKYSRTTYDAEGNETKEYTNRRVFVQPRGVYHSEFYEAAQAGLRPSLNLTISNRADYNEEKIVKFHDVYYDVIRVDWTSLSDSVSLVCEVRDGSL